MIDPDTLWCFRHPAAGEELLLATKWNHYFDVYNRHFSKYVGQSPKVLEMGVYQGGSLKMYEQYFGEGASVVGIDIFPGTIKLRDVGLNVHLGSQVDAGFLRALTEEYGPWDIVIDDASHRTAHQLESFRLFMQPGWMADNSTYLIEDTHTSEWPEYIDAGADLYKTMYDVVRSLNGWHTRNGEQAPPIAEADCPAMTRQTTSVAFYDSIIVVERGQHVRPGRCHNGGKGLV